MRAAPFRPTPSWPRAKAPPHRPRPPSSGQHCAPSPAARSPACWRASGASTSATCGPSEVPRLRRREDPLPQPPYVPLAARQSTGASRGSRPLVRSPRLIAAASNLSFGSGVSVIFLFTGSPGHVSALSGRAPGPVSGRLSRTTGGGASHLVPVSRCLSAAGVRFLAILLPAGELGLPYGRLTGQRRPDPDGVAAFRTHELRPGWVPPIPRGRRCSPRLGDSPPAPAASQRPVPGPRSNNPSAGLPMTRHQQGFTRFTG